MDAIVREPLPSENGNGNIMDGRMSIVETKVNSFESRFDAVFAKLDHIETALGERNKTNWGLILSAMAFALLATSTFVGVLVAFNAAKVSPLETDMIRARSEAQTIAMAVLKQNDAIVEQKVQLAHNEEQDKQVRKELDAMQDKGTDGARLEIALLKYRMDQKEKKKP